MTQKKTIQADKLEPLIKSLITSNLSPKNEAGEIYTEDNLPMKASFEELGSTSLDLVELIMDFDEKFDISISDEEAKNILTPQQAVDSIRALLKSENRLI